jgi:hypothetical protein
MRPHVRIVPGRPATPTGCSAAWSACLLRMQEVGRSNRPSPTGSPVTLSPVQACVAQGPEHPPVERGVAGSRPVAGAARTTRWCELCGRTSYGWSATLPRLRSRVQVPSSAREGLPRKGFVLTGATGSAPHSGCGGSSFESRVGSFVGRWGNREAREPLGSRGPDRRRVSQPRQLAPMVRAHR